MKIAHLSDLHLGYGTGGRAADVLRVFDAALEDVAEIGVDVVAIAGDVFDHPNVTASPLASFSRSVDKLARALPGVVVAVVAGARDAPLDPQGHGPLAVIGAHGAVEAAVGGVRRLDVGGGELGVTLVPHPAVVASRPLGVAPDGRARWNVLVAYASADPPPGSESGAGEGDRARADVHEIDLAGWDYVALGSRHAWGQVAPRAWYSGSLERVGADPWAEAGTEKGFLVADLEAGTVEHRPAPARAAVSLAPVEATGGGTATVARRLSEALAGVPGGIDGKLLRVPVRGLTPEDLAVLDREVLSGVRRRVAELRVDAVGGRDASRGGGPRRGRS